MHNLSPMNGPLRIFLLSLFLSIIFAGHGQYCTSCGPSQTTWSNVESAYILGEGSSAITYTGCPGVIGLQDLTSSQFVTLNADQSYILYVQFGTCDNNWQGAGEAWIDFDGDQTFELSESIGTWQGTPPVPMSTFNFTVPSNCINGAVRLRITQQESQTPPLNPCLSFTWGCTIDFKVDLVNNPVDCNLYPGDDKSDAKIVSALPYQENNTTSVCYTNVFPSYDSPDVFYRIIPAQLGATYINISLCGSSFDTHLAILNTQDSVLLGNDDGNNCSTASELTFYAAGLDTIYAVVQGWNLEEGDYSIEITEADGTGIQEDLSDIKVYPNPTKDVLRIEGLKSQSNIRLIDLSGKTVLTNVVSNNDQIDLSEVNSGVYYIEIENNSSRIVKKIIVQP